METFNILDLCKKSSSPTLSENSNDARNLISSHDARNSQQKRNKRIQKMRSVSEKEHAVNLYLKGTSKAEVSRQTNVPESTLRGWIKETQNQRNYCIRRQSSSPSRECSTHSDNDDNLMHNCSSNDDSSKNRRCVIQPPLKKRKLSQAILEQIGYFGGTYEEKTDPPPVEAPIFQRGGIVPPSICYFNIYTNSIQHDNILKNVKVTGYQNENLSKPLEMNPKIFQSPPVYPFARSVPSPDCCSLAYHPISIHEDTLDHFKNLQNANSLKSFRRKQNSMVSSGQSDIENMDPFGQIDEAAACPKEKKSRRKRQSGSKPEQQTDEEKMEWLRQRQQEMSLKVMESVMNEQKVNVDESQKANEIPTIEEAIEHGERFQAWLEKCSDPAVSMYKVQEFRKLLSSIIASRKRKLAS